MAGPSLKQWAAPEPAPPSPGDEPSPVMAKPPGGEFLCSFCKHLSADGKHCDSPGYQSHMGTDVLPRPADQMCSKWFEDREGRDLDLSQVAEPIATQ